MIIFMNKITVGVLLAMIVRARGFISNPGTEFRHRRWHICSNENPDTAGSYNGRFLLERNIAGPTSLELSNENLLKILLQENTDEETNFLAWKCLGYRYDPDTKSWSNENTFPKWREKFPEPPDLIGVTRYYSKEVDGPVMKANQALVRSIPMEYKQILKQEMKKVGWTGYMLEGLTPNKTRRAQVTNWILYFREKLWGVSIEELVQRKASERSGTEN